MEFWTTRETRCSTTKAMHSTTTKLFALAALAVALNASAAVSTVTNLAAQLASPATAGENALLKSSNGVAKASLTITNDGTVPYILKLDTKTVTGTAQDVIAFSADGTQRMAFGYSDDVIFGKIGVFLDTQNSKTPLVWKLDGSASVTFGGNITTSSNITASTLTATNGDLNLGTGPGLARWTNNSASTNAALFVGSNTMPAITIGPGGNVGIGTNNPVDGLVVSGARNISARGGVVFVGTDNNDGAFSSYQLILAQTSSDGFRMRDAWTLTSDGSADGAAWLKPANAAGNPVLLLLGGGSKSTAMSSVTKSNIPMFLAATGAPPSVSVLAGSTNGPIRLGIGTNSPSGSLHVHGSAAVGFPTAQPTNGTTGFLPSCHDEPSGSAAHFTRQRLYPCDCRYERRDFVHFCERRMEIARRYQRHNRTGVDRRAQR